MCSGAVEKRLGRRLKLIIENTKCPIRSKPDSQEKCNNNQDKEESSLASIENLLGQALGQIFYMHYYFTTT